MKIAIVCLSIWVGALMLGFWQESSFFGLGVFLLCQAYLIAHDLPKP